MNSKHEFRKEAIVIRQGISEAIKQQKSIEICELILKSDLYNNADTVLLFYSVKGEPNMKRIGEKALGDGKRLAYPRCASNGVVQFHQITDFSSLRKGKYGIPEPDGTLPQITDFSNAICITPGVAFSKTKQRIGYGGGYYDRFLSENSCISIGVCFSELVFDSIPQEKTDKKVDYLIFA